MFSSISFADWTKVSTGGDREVNLGINFYVDFETIRKVDEYIYFWTLGNYLEPFEGDLSYKSYHKGDCKIFRYKRLTASFYKEPMGKGTAKIIDLKKFPQFSEWEYPTPDTVEYAILNSVCNN